MAQSWIRRENWQFETHTFDFDFNKKMNRALIHELATGRFITQREDALFLGPPGTGKSHLAQAIGRAVIQQGYRVIYREAHTLLEDIADATLDGTRKAYFSDESHRECQRRLFTLAE